MRYLIPVLLFVFFIVGCTNDSGDRLQLIDLSNTAKPNIDIHLSQITDSVEFVFLETGDSCLIGNIWDIEHTDSLILIVDQSLYKVLLFSRKGKFLTNIGKRGQGPKEYSQVLDCCFSSTGEEILVLCNAPLRETHVYNLNGDFLRKLSCGNLPFRFTSFNSKIVYHHGLPSSHLDNDGYSVGVLDENLKMKRLLKREDLYPGMSLGIHKSHFTQIGDELSIWELYYDTVYYMDKRCQIIPKFAIKHRENYIYANGLIPMHEQNQRIAKSTIMLDLLDCQDYVFIKTAVERKYKNAIYDKSQECLYNVDKYLTNDIAGPSKFWPFKALKNNLICSIYQVGDLKESMIVNSAIEYVNQEKNRLFWEYVDSASEYDNPCLLFINLKRENTII